MARSRSGGQPSAGSARLVVGHAGATASAEEALARGAPRRRIPRRLRLERLEKRTLLAFTNIGAQLPAVDDCAMAWGDYDKDGDLDLVLAGASVTEGHITRIYRNDGGTFAAIGAGLPGLTECAVAWGDYDNDGDLDLALAGVGGAVGVVTRVYRNDAGVFRDTNAGLPGVRECSVAWGDYDNDGDLDLAIAGDADSAYISRVYRNDAGAFTDIGAGLPGVERCSLAWGDYDNDGDLDLAIAGFRDPDKIARIYRNDGGAFTDISAGFTGVTRGGLAWGDYDNDGDLDLVLTGEVSGNSSLISRIYRNDGEGAFTDINAGLPGVGWASTAWGDYDNDGDLDLFLAGEMTGHAIVSRIYRNNAGVFSDISAGLPGTDYGSVAWGDYDNDGDLDLAMAGNTGSVYISAIYRNSSVPANSAPTAPTGLSATVDGRSVTLSWHSATDAQTPAGGLTYNLCVGTTPGGSDIVGPMADRSDGWRQVPRMGNVQESVSWRLTGLADGTYYWSVQALDSAFAGSAFSTEDSFRVGDFTAPTASLAAANVTTGGGTSYQFAVTYSDNVAVDVSDIGSGDVRVTGPAGFNVVANFVSLNSSADGTPRTATYRITPPGGAWDYSDSGTYTVVMESGQVTDTRENPVPAGALGTFDVSIASLLTFS